MRLFTGIDLPLETKEELESIVYGLEGVKVVKKENFHITLSFLGEVEQKRIADISEALSEVNSSHFSLSGKGCGTFMMNDGSGVIFFRLYENPLLTQVQKAQEKILRSLGFRLKKQSYVPHITLGRFKSIPPGLPEYLEENANISIEIPEIDEFQLFSSVLKKEGAIYKIEEVFSFF